MDRRSIADGANAAQEHLPTPACSSVHLSMLTYKLEFCPNSELCQVQPLVGQQLDYIIPTSLNSGKPPQ